MRQSVDPEDCMEGKARFIFPIVITAIIAFIALPFARDVTLRIVGLIDGAA
jgi:hypothetical protein